ncbi:PorP/SprF family type IX secretion system membrane protein [Persicobacter psychrovividus]|uniref:OmpA-like domain-containing protein n=1 Tax=Persicobacter psychrovividus TaxID=387638 RepID=A0ABM7VJ77_9BACT|nr:hypothetical protein PEPS_33260 [Persicobacter psychrovividus]
MKTHFIKFALLLFSFFVLGDLKAQNTFLSQHDYVPYYTNPAAVGQENFDRLLIHYRNTTLGSGFGLKNTMAGYSHPLYDSKHKRRFGAVSGSVSDFRSGTAGAFTNTQAMAGFNYNLPIARNHQIGVGMQGSYSFLRIDWTRLTTDAQWIMGNFDPSADLGENLDFTKNDQFNINVGMNWMWFDDAGRINGTFGVAMYDAVNSRNFIQDERTSGTQSYVLSGEVKVAKFDHLALRPMGRAVIQTNSNTYEAGLKLAYEPDMIHQPSVALSSYYRFDQAMVIAMQVYFQNLSLGISYDIPTGSKVGGQLGANNAIEFGASFHFGHMRAQRALGADKAPYVAPATLQHVKPSTIPSRKMKVQEQEQPPSIVDVNQERMEEDLRNEIENTKLRFALGKFDLTEDSDKKLQRIAEIMAKYPNTKILILGHTCTIGDEDINKFVGTERALAARDRLVEAGVPRGNIRIKGMSYTQPIATNDTDDGRAKNRRAQFIIIDQ